MVGTNTLTEMETRIKNKIIRLFKENNFGDVVITMKSNGDELLLAPYLTYGYEGNDIDVKIPHVFVGCKRPGINMSGTLNDVAHAINEYDDLLKDAENDIRELQKYYTDHCHEDGSLDAEDFDLYSDWYKDIYGRRPRNIIRRGEM